MRESFTPPPGKQDKGRRIPSLILFWRRSTTRSTEVMLQRRVSYYVRPFASPPRLWDGGGVLG